MTPLLALVVSLSNKTAKVYFITFTVLIIKSGWHKIPSDNIFELLISVMFYVALTVFTKVTTFFSKLPSVASQVQTHITDQRWSRIHMSTLVNTFLQYSLPQSFRRNLAWNCTVFWLHFVSMLKVWRSVSKGCSLPICLSSPPAFLRETNCPTSPPVSPLTHPWWWASCLHSTLSYPSVMVLQEMIIFSCVCVHLWDSWGQWVPCWNVWTGGEWEWSWKTAVLEYPSCSFTPTHCETCINVALTRTHTHTENCDYTL